MIFSHELLDKISEFWLMENRELFSSQAALYAKYRPTYPAELYQFILGKVTNFDLAWDCATGNGQAALALSPYFRKIIATDISEPQLEQAPRRENIEYLLSPAEKTPFPDHVFDLVTVAQAYHWFQFDKFHEEVSRVSQKRAILAVWIYEKLHVTPEIDQMILKFHDDTLGSFWDSRRKFITEGFKEVPFEFEEIPSPEFRIESNWEPGHLKGYLESWSSVQAFIRKNGYNPVNDFIRSVEEIWPQRSTTPVYFPVFLRLGILNP